MIYFLFFCAKTEASEATEIIPLSNIPDQVAVKTSGDPAAFKAESIVEPAESSSKPYSPLLL
jgi:hypothetical protein